MKKQTIPIVYACDEKFLKQTYVSIYSVLENRKQDYILKFYIMVPEGCIEKKYDEKWLFEDYCIEYKIISSKYFQEVKMVIQHISKPTYYRLLIPMVLSEYDKCLYIDGDTICCGDIKSLYDIELSGNLLGAVIGAMIPFDEQYWKEILNVPSAENYINAGVLSMNLKQMREKNIVEKFLECSKKELPCQDQDVLNICCYGNIKILPLKYNIYSVVFNMSEEMLLTRYKKSEIEEAFQNPIIIHYPGEFAKPWNNVKCVKSKEWWEYAHKVFSERIIEEMFIKAEKRMERYSYNRLFEAVSKSSQIVIFGFSEIGQSLCDEIDKKYPNKVMCFADNAQGKKGKKYNNYEVKSLAEIKEELTETIIIISSQNYSDVIEKQLIQNEGFSADKIFIYRKKTKKYIYCMDKKYIEEIKEDISYDNISWTECFA